MVCAGTIYGPIGSERRRGGGGAGVWRGGGRAEEILDICRQGSPRTSAQEQQATHGLSGGKGLF